MPRLQKSKTERANVAPDTVLQAIRAIRSVARGLGNPFRSLTRYCSRASEDNITGMSQSATFSRPISCLTDF